jgi:hypothetical protein
LSVPVLTVSFKTIGGQQPVAHFLIAGIDGFLSD